MKKTIIIILLLIGGSFMKSFAQKSAIILSDKTGWHKIGETTADFKKDSVEIEIIGADRFASIKFLVKDASLQLLNLEIHFENDTIQNIVVNSKINKGEQSRVFDLKGTENALKRIEIVYKTLPNQKEEKAQVELWGLKTNSK